MPDTISTAESTAADTQAAASTPAAAPGLSIGDLVLVAQIVQKSSTAGVFRAEELKLVGDFYDRLVAFLESTGAIQRPKAGEQTTAPASA